VPREKSSIEVEESNTDAKQGERKGKGKDRERVILHQCSMRFSVLEVPALRSLSVGASTHSSADHTDNSKAIAVGYP
jgi:hypothetical protein